MSVAVTTDGLFNDSITQTTNGSFDVVWSGTQNVTGYGVLFVYVYCEGRCGFNIFLFNRQIEAVRVSLRQHPERFRLFILRALRQMTHQKLERNL